MLARSFSTDAARLEHTVLPPHEESGYTSRSAPYAIGVAFTGQDAAVLSHPGAPARTTGFAPGTVGINGARPLTWHRTTGRSENVEIIPSAAALARAAEEHGVVWEDLGDYRQSTADVAVWAAAVRARHLLLTGSVPDGAVDELAVTVLAHVAADHLGTRPARNGRLGRTQLRVLTDRIRDDPFRPHPVEELAGAVHLSPYHFLRTFGRTVGITPHQFVLAVRAEHARRLLHRPGASVASVAADLGVDARQLRRMHCRVIGVSPRGT